jgi:hypothetical protein
VGAPKCGTTALYGYLSGHPAVYMPRLKEPQFFCSDFPQLNQIGTFEAYRQLFAAASADQLIGEGSVWYLYSRVAIGEILRLNPRARIIAILRNPVDMAYSLHSHFLRGSKETCDFEQAWRLQTSRRAGQNLPRYCPEPSCLQNQQVCSLANQVRRLQYLVPQSQLRIYIFEEMFSQPGDFYRDVLRFLDLPDDGRSEFPVANENRTPSSPVIRRLVASMPRIIVGQDGALRAGMRRLGIRPRYFFVRLTTVPAPRVALRPEFRRELMAAFACDVAELVHRSRQKIQ